MSTWLEAVHQPMPGHIYLEETDLVPAQVRFVNEGAGAPVMAIFVHVGMEAARALHVAKDVLSPEEQSAMGNFHSQDDARRYTVAHVVLRFALSKLTGQRACDLTFTRSRCPICGGPQGRPTLVGRGPEFSLSHAGDWVLLAFADQPVGADIEPVIPYEWVDTVASSLNDRDAETLITLTGIERRLAVTRAWTRREACGKAQGMGLAHEGMGRRVGTGRSPWLADSRLALYDLHAPVGYLASVAMGLDPESWTRCQGPFSTGAGLSPS